MTRRLLKLMLVGLLGCAGAAGGQERLDRAVDAARAAWLAHDAAALLTTSDTVRLDLPGVAESPWVRPGQAARLLERYLKGAQEVTFTLREVRHLAADHAYAEMVRRFVVAGTADERQETVYLGFRVVDGEWRLREVRVTP